MSVKLQMSRFRLAHCVGWGWNSDRQTPPIIFNFHSAETQTCCKNEQNRTTVNANYFEF